MGTSSARFLRVITKLIRSATSSSSYSKSTITADSASRALANSARTPTERMRVFSWLGLAPALSTLLAGLFVDVADDGAVIDTPEVNGASCGACHGRRGAGRRFRPVRRCAGRRAGGHLGALCRGRAAAR